MPILIFFEIKKTDIYLDFAFKTKITLVQSNLKIPWTFTTKVQINGKQIQRLDENQTHFSPRDKEILKENNRRNK